MRMIIALLCLSNVLCVVLAMALIRKLQHESHPPVVSWLPPDVPRIQTFRYQPIFGGNVTAASQQAWTKLIPKGKGFVHIHNDTELDPMLGFDPSQQQHTRAMVAVFHQLHCLYITRSSYFAARAGNLDDIRPEHLAHCCDYLRQAIMCAGDMTLEWVGASTNGTGSTGWGYQHQCRDYGALYAWAEKNRLTDTQKIHT